MRFNTNNMWFTCTVKQYVLCGAEGASRVVAQGWPRCHQMQHCAAMLCHWKQCVQFVRNMAQRPYVKIINKYIMCEFSLFVVCGWGVALHVPLFLLVSSKDFHGPLWLNIIHGEQKSPYFFRLEKQNYAHNTLHKLQENVSTVLLSILKKLLHSVLIANFSSFNHHAAMKFIYLLLNFI